MNELPLQSSPGDWQRLNGKRTGEILREEVGSFRRVIFRHQLKRPDSSLAGTRILFFSDLHIRPQHAECFPRRLRWNGAEKIRDFLTDTVAEYHPDHLFFGGDLMAYSCCFPECIELFRSLRCSGLKLAVYGNWDLMRPWLPKRVWRDLLRDAGVELLVNESVRCGGLRVFGLDEIRKGCPEYRAPETPPELECVLVHNPDTVPQFLSGEMLSRIDLILCGHTHGGQIRIPGFGAMMCSSRHWKRFEYGLYENRRTGTRMLVSAGLGVTFIRKRIFCPPEAVIIELV